MSFIVDIHVDEEREEGECPAPSLSTASIFYSRMGGLGVM